MLVFSANLHCTLAHKWSSNSINPKLDEIFEDTVLGMGIFSTGY